MKIKKGDKIKIATGKDKGKEAVVERVYDKSNKVLVKDTNVYKKRVRKNEQMPQGGVVDIPRPLNVAKVALVCPKCGKVTRVQYKTDKSGRKYRVCSKCNAQI